MRCQFFVALTLLFTTAGHCEVAPVAIIVPDARAWVGQRLPFFVELRARGSFGGSAIFSLPEISRSVILKLGNPVVSSREIEGDSWFVQTHEFALFSQLSGELAIPAFDVRFGSRDGFTGPVVEQQAQVPGASVEIRRPPGSDRDVYLVTTDELTIEERWDSQPGKLPVGAVVKREIVQQARQMTGMALAPPLTTVPEGVRVYSTSPELIDRTERGEFAGERRETLTYLFQQPGIFELPQMTYVWWDPTAEQLVSRTLPGATFEVAGSIGGPGTVNPAEERWTGLWLLWPLALVGLGIGIWQRRGVYASLLRFLMWLNPPERRAANRLLRACQLNEPVAAHKSWAQWRATQPVGLQLNTEFELALVALQRAVYGPTGSVAWRGAPFARAFAAQRAAILIRSEPGPPADLPALNPR